VEVVGGWVVEVGEISSVSLGSGWVVGLIEVSTAVVEVDDGTLAISTGAVLEVLSTTSKLESLPAEQAVPKSASVTPAAAMRAAKLTASRLELDFLRVCVLRVIFILTLAPLI